MQSQLKPYPEHLSKEELDEQLLEPVDRNDPYPGPYTVEATIYLGDGPNKFYIEGYATDEDREGDFTYSLVALQRWEDQDPVEFLGLAYKATYRVTYIQGYHESLRYDSFLQDQWEADQLREDNW